MFASSASLLDISALPTARNLFCDSSITQTISPLSKSENFVIPGLITFAPLHTNLTAPMSTVTYGNFSKIGMSSKNGSISSPIFTAVISLPVIITPFSFTS
ncbi:uncharacterized protein METZ01_LOCUS301864 [marine metagenome]|uniref:Uncharacterized protein n=1 Tax=marine metagenome TaxID=408172 RepID=A0A382MK30_9ZZZZ